MEEYQRWALPCLPVGDGLPVDLYRTQLGTSQRFRPNRSTSARPRLAGGCPLERGFDGCTLIGSMR